MPSHPVWVRGLKQNSSHFRVTRARSHPVWVRGLKHATRTISCHTNMSHPVWVRGLKRVIRGFVRNFVKSHPVWVRGLKHKNLAARLLQNLVAPRVGAWIETFTLPSLPVQYSRSHPVWVRGLKQTIRPCPPWVLSRTPCGCVD